LNRDAGSPDLPDLALNMSWLKFSKSKYPMVVYEPTDELQVNRINDLFLASGVNHTAGGASYLLHTHTRTCYTHTHTHARTHARTPTLDTHTRATG
jgi:hypothetical protein